MIRFDPIIDPDNLLGHRLSGSTDGSIVQSNGSFLVPSVQMIFTSVIGSWLIHMFSYQNEQINSAHLLVWWVSVDLVEPIL